ncbi:ARM repeat-containing protein [Exidia glandulosa HHB12029]|uniref:ARM repeat-containing protein n=1 Tax=Exidia glandulosa HHB12029 TaxID=1314781 RepID=A0A165JX97_EXIGL|nr:ARM repeat-containing protein [Exidia glandulosa HHB12029]
MDPETLSRLFATTYNPDPNVRKAAELEIRKLAGQEGTLAALIQVIGSDAVDVSVRLACTVYLKNRIRRSYFVDPEKPLPDQTPIQNSDRVAIRQNIFALLVAAPTRSIRAPLAECLRSLISHDYPEKWPTLLDEIKTLLASSRIQEVIAGCVASLELTKAFRYRPGTELTHTLVPQLFPQLVNIALQLFNAPATPEIPLLLHLILKTYKQTLAQTLSPHQQSHDSIVPWGRLLFQVVALRVPQDHLPENEEAREASEWAKAKKWAYGCLNRLFTRYGNPSQLPSSMKVDYIQFAQHFVTAFAPEIFKAYLSQVELFVSGQEWLSRKCQSAILSYFSECIKPKSTWVLLKPHFQTLVSSFVFPHLCFTETHRELWESDPIEYARMSIDEYEDLSSPVSAATYFLLTLAGARPKTTFIPLLTFVQTILGGTAPSTQKYGALKMTAVLVPHMVRNPAVRTSVAPFLAQHVLPSYAHPDGFMRNIALDVAVAIEKAEFRWPSPEDLEPHYAAALRALDDPDLPNRVQAAILLSEMVAHHASVRAALSGNIGKVVQDLLKLSDETDMDVLNSCMEVLVEHFDTELMPVATQLTMRLVATYMRLMADVASEDPEESDVGMSYSEDDIGAEDKTFAAMGTCKTIRTIIGSLENQKEILLQVQEIVIPVLTYTLSKQSVQAVELYDNMYEIVDGLTFNLRVITPSLWPVFELTYQRYKTNAADFLDEMLPSLENFMTWGSEAFVARPDYRGMVVDIYTSAMTNDHLGAMDRCNASKLIEAALLNLRGHMDDHLPTIVATALKGVVENPDHVKSARLANLQVLINCVLYNAPAALQLLVSAGAARAFFDKWFTAVRTENGLPRVHDKKLSTLACCELLKLPGSAVPPELQEGWVGIVSSVLTLLKELPEAIAKRKALEEAFEADDDEEEEEILDTVDEEGDVWDEDSAYMDFLAKESSALRKSRPSGVEEESDDESEDDEEIEEELGYLSPLEPVNPYVSFKAALTALQMQNPAVYQASTTSLSQEQQAFLMEVMKLAESDGAVPSS